MCILLEAVTSNELIEDKGSIRMLEGDWTEVEGHRLRVK